MNGHPASSKRTYLAAGVCLGLIPVVFIGAVVIHGMIDPEMAARHANYERNYRLLESLRTWILHGAFIAMLVFWFATCMLVLKAKRRSLLWSAFGLLGPLGFAFIAALKAMDADSADAYRRFIARMGIFSRIAYETLLFVGIVALAIAAVSLIEELQIARAAYLQGVSVEQIMRERDASSGMYAFSELVQTMYLIVCLYFLVPLGVNGFLWLVRRNKPAAVH